MTLPSGSARRSLDGGSSGRLGLSPAPLSLHWYCANWVHTTRSDPLYFHETEGVKSPHPYLFHRRSTRGVINSSRSKTGRLARPANPRIRDSTYHSNLKFLKPV